MTDPQESTQIPATGFYDLHISGHQDHVESFGFAMRRVTNKLVNTQLGQTVTGTITVPGEQDVLRFRASAGQELDLSIISRQLR